MRCRCCPSRLLCPKHSAALGAGPADPCQRAYSQYKWHAPKHTRHTHACTRVRAAGVRTSSYAGYRWWWLCGMRRRRAKKRCATRGPGATHAACSSAARQSLGSTADEAPARHAASTCARAYVGQGRRCAPAVWPGPPAGRECLPQKRQGAAMLCSTSRRRACQHAPSPPHLLQCSQRGPVTAAPRALLHQPVQPAARPCTAPQQRAPAHSRVHARAVSLHPSALAAQQARAPTPGMPMQQPARLHCAHLHAAARAVGLQWARMV